MARWAWKIDLKPLMGKLVRIETKDGIYMNGVLTGMNVYTFEMDKRNVRVPIELQLDNDPEKVLDVARIVRVEVVRGGRR